MLATKNRMDQRGKYIAANYELKGQETARTKLFEQSALDGGDDTRWQPLSNAIELRKGVLRPMPHRYWNADGTKDRRRVVRRHSRPAVGAPQDGAVLHSIRHHPAPHATLDCGR